MKKKVEQLVPRSRTDGLIIQALAEEVLVYDLHRHKAHCLNRTAAAMWNRCDGKTTIAQLAELMAKEFDTPVADEFVRIGLDQLRKARLVDQDFAALSTSSSAAMSRRELMRRVGLAAAVGLPVVSSIIAPKAAQAANCRPNGEACNGNGNCCSQNCVGNICV